MTERVVLKLSKRGVLFEQYLWWFYALLAALLGVFGGVFAVKAIFETRGPCEAGTIGGLGLSVAFLGVAALFARPAVRSIPGSAAASRDPGQVTIDPEALLVDAPGILHEPQRIEKAWVLDVVERGTRKDMAGMARITWIQDFRTSLLRFRSPMGLPTAAGLPAVPKSPLPAPPAPWDEVRGLALAFEDRDASISAQRSWLAVPPALTPSAPPAPVSRPPGKLWRDLCPIVVMVAGIATLWADIPRGAGCP